MLQTATFVPERMREAADTATGAATDLAEHLVRAGVPFREAHELVATLVRQASERGVSLDDLVAAEPRLGPDALALLEPGTAVRRRTSRGGAGPAPVAVQLELAQGQLDEQTKWLA
jgi:argininosuccinate lyase